MILEFLTWLAYHVALPAYFLLVFAYLLNL